jgi:predicted nucleic acid-binding protein
MTVVVADTSPINYLVIINEIEILPRLYHGVVIPEEVFGELTDERAPLEVREWAGKHPEWVEVRRGPARDPSLMDLDAGEGAAITLAGMETEVLLLMDETAGRLEASRRGIPSTGTLGVLRAAALARFIDLPSALERLLATNFRVSRSLVAELVAEDADRNARGG